MGQTYNVLKTSLSRVFIIEGRAAPDHAPVYMNAMRATGISQGYGDVTAIEIPSADSYGQFDEIGEVEGATERAKLSLEGRYALDLKSTLLRLANKGCKVDVQIHLGNCTDPRDFGEFKKALILEAAKIITYSTDDLGALASGDNKEVNEKADISAKKMYEILPLAVAERASTIVTNEIVDVTICDSVSCGGDCGSESGGCNKIFAISKAAGGSAGTPPDIVYSIDGGVTWYAHDIDTLTSAQDPTGIDCFDGYAVVTSNGANSISYCDLDEFDGVTDPAWTEVTTGFVAAKEPNAIKATGNRAFIVGDGGYVYLCENPASGVTVLDAGVATVDNLLAVDAISDSYAVAGGQNGAVIYTVDGETWAAAAHPVGVGVHVNAVMMKSKLEWWVGTSSGRLFYTKDSGVTWVEKSFSGSGAGSVRSLSLSTDSVFYMSHDTATPRGRIFRTYDGGEDWTAIPESTGTMPNVDRFTAIAACKSDANKVVGGGLHDNGSDGVIVVANASE